MWDQSRPLHVAQSTVSAGETLHLPELDKAQALGYRPRLALIRLGGEGAVFWRDDGEAPSIDCGMPIVCGEERYEGDPLNFLFVATGAVTLHVAYYAGPDDEA